MGVVLSPSEAKAPLELPGGVKIWVKPVRQADFDLARGRVISTLAKALDGAEAATRYGLSTAQTQTFSEDDIRIGDSMLAIELGILAIQKWEGVFELDGEGEPSPAPIEHAYIVMLMNEWADDYGSYAAYFLTELKKRRSLRRTEGKL